eukprot:6282234-Pyramimonas_sp.AAC.1
MKKLFVDSKVPRESYTLGSNPHAGFLHLTCLAEETLSRSLFSTMRAPWLRRPPALVPGL